MGILAALVVSLAAWSVEYFVPSLSATLMSLLLGIAAGNAFIRGNHFDPGLKFTEKYILESAIVLIGFGFNIGVLKDLGGGVFLWLVLSVILIVAAALLAGKIFGTSKNFNYLLGIGSAICGSAAIAAAAPLLRAKEEETGLALTLINLLGLIGIVILPLLSFSLGYTDTEAGLLTGGVLQSMGHVVAAAFSLGEITGEAATVVKMGRILLLVPFLLFLFFMDGRKQSGSSAKPKFPIFIGLFILSVSLSQIDFFPRSWSNDLAVAGDLLLVIAMAAIGLRIKIKPLLKISGKGSLLALLVFVFQVIIFLGLIRFRS